VDPDWRETAERPHDPGLSPDGVDQVHRLGTRVKTLDVDRIVASPFLRTVHTAHVVASKVDEPVYLEPGLGEWVNADWFDALPEPLSMEALQAQFGQVRNGHVPCATPSYPETKSDALARIGEAARCLVEQYAGETLLLVGHGITVQGVLLGLVEDVPDTGVPLASLTHLTQSGDGWEIAARNDTTHLSDGATATDRMN